MTKYNVYLRTHVTVKIVNVEAESDEQAARIAETAADLGSFINEESSIDEIPDPEGRAYLTDIKYIGIDGYHVEYAAEEGRNMGREYDRCLDLIPTSEEEIEEDERIADEECVEMLTAAMEHEKLFKQISAHIDHEAVCARDINGNVAVECKDCGHTVIASANKPPERRSDDDTELQ
jgi:hypothetical protein